MNKNNIIDKLKDDSFKKYISKYATDRILKISKKEITIIILCNDNIKYTSHCIKNIYENIYEQNFEILFITDNTSYTKTISNCDSEYIILLNNNVTVYKNWDIPLIYALKYYPDIFGVMSLSNINLNIDFVNIDDFFDKANKIQENMIPYFDNTSPNQFCCAFRKKDLNNMNNICIETLIKSKNIVVSSQSLIYVNIKNNIQKFEKYDNNFDFTYLEKIFDEYKIYRSGSIFFEYIIDYIIEFFNTKNVTIKTTNEITDKIIIFNLQDLENVELPDNYIIYNFEQLAWNKHVMSENINLYKKSKIIFEYSQKNFAFWFTNNIFNVIFFPYICFSAYKPININFNRCKNNILFYGCLTERRKNIIKNIKNKIKTTHTLFGKKKVEEVYNSKYIIDLGAYTPHIKNGHRINDLIYGRRICISEIGYDLYYERLYKYVTFTFNDNIGIDDIIIKLNKLTEKEYDKITLNNLFISKFINNIILNDIVNSSKLSNNYL